MAAGDPAAVDVAGDTVLDSELPPDPAGARMQAQHDEVHARLFGGAPPQQRMGRYLVEGTLGQGGMGKVLRAHDETLGRDVALKVLHDGGSTRHEQRLLREAQALARLSHPNVVRVYDVDEIDGRLCMAMELVRGTPLRIWQRTPRPWSQVLEIYLQAGRGLAAAHAEGLVHRDFKPANCILDEEGVVKVLDFGLARGVDAESEEVAVEAERTHDASARPGTSVTESATASASRSMRSSSSSASIRASRSQRMFEQDLTRTGTMLGTVAYMAPEQLMGKPAGPASDLFSFCVSLYEALYGRRPFHGSTAMSTLYAIQSELVEGVPSREGLPAVPRWLLEVLRRGLSVAIHQRWPGMEAMLSVIERRLARRRRRRMLALGTVLVATVGTVLGASGMLEGERPCDALRGQSISAWTDHDRATVRSAFEGVTTPGAGAVLERVEAGLDDYARAWSRGRVDACEATWERREAGEQGLARRMACLERRLPRVRAAVERLSTADASTVAHAVAMVEGLPPLAPCTDLGALLEGPAPIPEALAEDAVRVRELVARAWVFGATSDEEHGVEAALRAVEVALAISDRAPVLELEARLNAGHALRRARRFEGSREQLDRALALAEELGDREHALEVLRELVLLADDDHDPTSAQAWLVVLRGKLARVGDEPRYQALRWAMEAVVALQVGHDDAAVAAATEAVALYDELEAPPVVARVEVLVGLGDALERTGDLTGAASALERARSLADGGGHPLLVASVDYRRGYLRYVQGDLEAARELLGGAIGTYEAFGGPTTAAAVRARLLLAQLLQLEGDLVGAMAQASLAKRSLGPDGSPSIRSALESLEGYLHRAREQWGPAIESYRRAREAMTQLSSPDRVELALLDSNTADCLVARGDLDAAEPLYDAAVSVLVVDTEPGDARRAYPRLGRAELRLRRGESAGAEDDLRAVLALDAALARNPALAANARWALARALRTDDEASGEATAEAATLAAEAREAFAGAGITDVVDQIDAWVERCGPSCDSVPSSIPPTSTPRPPDSAKGEQR